MKSLLNSWVWKMAWRDARTGRKKLLLALLPVVVGVGCMVGIASFSKNLELTVHQQAKTLLGADLSIEGRQPFSKEAQNLIASLGGQQARQTSFSSMVYFPRPAVARLAQVRALEGAFPFYGVLETDPPPAALSFQKGPYALVDDNLMLQQGIAVGDSIRIGATTFEIAGRLKKIPGETFATALISPRVYIPMAYLEQTQLLQRGSLVRYRVYFKLAPTLTPTDWYQS
jgi:putative ABC transport system permease protein